MFHLEQSVPRTSWFPLLLDRRVLFAGGAWAVAAIGACFVPLFRDFGFERAFIAGVLAGLVGPGLGAAAVARLTPRLGWLDAFLRALTLHASGVAMMALGGLISEWWRQPCDPGEGVVYFLLLPGVGGAFAIAVGMACRGLLGRWWLLGVGLLWGAELVAIAVHAYQTPQIFAFSLAFGWWPGSLYDEFVSPSTALIAHRGVAGLLALALVAFGRAFEGRRLHAVPLILALLLTGTALHLNGQGERFGFRTSAERIQRTLGGHARSPHFDIYFPRETSDEQVAELVRDHEYHWQRLRAWFDAAPSERIASYVHRSPEQKGQLIGASRTQIARPWALELHIHEVRTPHPTLGHELAHVFASEWATGLLQVPTRWGLWVDMGLVEGLAEATEEDVGPYDHHQSSKFLLERGWAPSPAEIMSPAGFWSAASSRAYAVAGSFLRWVKAEHGAEVIEAAYGQGGFERSRLRAWAADWRRWLAAEVELDPMARRAAEARHGRPSIFRRSCPHVTAELTREAKVAEQRGDFEAARNKLDQAYAYFPDPRHHLRLARAAFRSERAALTTELARFVLTATAAEQTHLGARELMAGLDWLQGRLPEARAAYARLSEQQTRFDGLRLQTARHAVLTSTVAGHPWLRDYLLGRAQEAQLHLPALVEAHPDLGLLRYLWARRLSPELGRAQLEAVDALPPVLRWEAVMMQARWAAQEGEYEAALRHFDSLDAEALPFEVRAERRRERRRAEFRLNWPAIDFDVTRGP